MQCLSLKTRKGDFIVFRQHILTKYNIQNGYLVPSTPEIPVIKIKNIKQQKDHKGLI
jgi:hypothetical protein